MEGIHGFPWGSRGSKGAPSVLPCDTCQGVGAPGSPQGRVGSGLDHRVGAGLREATGCTNVTDRTCTAVDPEHFSGDGSNKQDPCFNVECPDGTWRNGTSCDDETGEGYSCVACSSCGAALHQLADCTSTTCLLYTSDAADE